ncbi:MAG: flagellar filament capping protein FliD [Sphingomonadaceae bacterium]|nr:flagellar filament capping protein FliD [Sphingomonadaceae bacterium]
MTIVTTLGAGSGIDIQKLAGDIAEAQRAARAAPLTARSDRAQARISALAGIAQELDQFARSVDGLASSGALGPQATSSDPAAIAIRRLPGRAAEEGSRTIEVTRLATAQTLRSARFADVTAPVGEGAIVITEGSGAAQRRTTVRIGAANNSLAGLRDAINASGSGVTASLVADGGGSRLVVRGREGSANGFTVSPALEGGPQGFRYPPVGGTGLELATAAADAQLSVDGVAVERGSNRLDDVLPGFEIELRRAANGPVSLTAERPASQARDIADAFVAAYNSLAARLAAATRGRSDGNEAGPLQSASAVRSLAAELSRLTATEIAGRSLGALGFRTGRDGQLTLDREQFDRAVAADPGALDALIAPVRRSSSAAVTVSSAPSGRSGRFEITDLQPARAGTLTGESASAAFATPLEIDAPGASFSLAVDGGAAVAVTVAAGGYASGEAFAAALEAAANSALAGSARRISADWVGDRLRLTSASVGATSRLGLSGIEPWLTARLGLDTAVAEPGAAARGRIAGVEAVGYGTRLTAAAGSPASGLVLEIGAAPPQAATITIEDGLAQRLTRLSAAMTGPGGALASAQETRRSTTLAQALTDLQKRATTERAALLRQFTTMDRAVSAFKATGAQLQQQIDLWTKPNR